jgi:SAM-dependent methyltransferase
VDVDSLNGTLDRRKRRPERSMNNPKPDHAEFNNPRLVAVYNTVCPLDGYEQFYLELAKKLSAKTIIDVGCGTGLLTCELAKQGHRIIGVEPSNRMLEVARQSPCGKQVRWIEGDALALGEFNADLAIMTGHVAQFLVDEGYWLHSLQSIHQALRPRGCLAFESRNPAIQPWVNNQEHRDWHSATSPRRAVDPVEGLLETWSEPVKLEGESVTFQGHYLFKRTGEELISTGELIFRTREEITLALGKAGFSVDNVYGFWDWSLANADSPELIFVSTRV